MEVFARGWVEDAAFLSYCIVGRVSGLGDGVGEDLKDDAMMAS